MADRRDQTQTRNETHRNALDILISGPKHRFRSVSLNGFIDNRVCQIPDAFLIETLESIISARKDKKESFQTGGSDCMFPGKAV